MEADEAAADSVSACTTKFLCTPRSGIKKSLVKQKSSLNKSGILKKHSGHAGNTSVVFKHSLTSNNRHLARTLEETKQELAVATQMIIDLTHDNNVLSGKVLSFRRLADLKNAEVEQEVQSRVQRRLHDIGDMLGEIQKSRLVTAELVAAAIRSCNGFSAKSLEDTFNDSLLQSASIPARVVLGSKGRRLVASLRLPVDSPDDASALSATAGDVLLLDAMTEEPFAVQNNLKTTSQVQCMPATSPGAVVTVNESLEQQCAPRVAENTPQKQSSNLRKVCSRKESDRRTVHAPSKQLQSSEALAPGDRNNPISDQTSASLTKKMPIVNFDDVPVGARPTLCATVDSYERHSRHSGNWQEAIRLADLSKSETLPCADKYYLVLSPAKLFRKDAEGPPAPLAAPGCSAVHRCKKDGSAGVARRATTKGHHGKSTSCAKASLDDAGSSSANLSDKCNIGDESDSILHEAGTPNDIDDDTFTAAEGETGRPFCYEPGAVGSTLCETVDMDFTSVTKPDDVTVAIQSEPEMPLEEGLSATGTARVSKQLQAFVALASSPQRASQATSRKMDIVVSKPGELHYIVGSRDGSRPPNVDSRPASTSARSKKRQTFVASKKQGVPAPVQLEGQSLASVFDFNGTPVVNLRNATKDEYDLSLNETHEERPLQFGAGSRASRAAGAHASHIAKAGDASPAVSVAVCRTVSSAVSLAAANLAHDSQAVEEGEPKKKKARQAHVPLSVKESAMTPIATPMKRLRPNKSPLDAVNALSPSDQGLEREATSAGVSTEKKQQSQLAKKKLADGTIALPSLSPAFAATAHKPRPSMDDSFNIFSDSLIERFRPEVCTSGADVTSRHNPESKTVHHGPAHSLGSVIKAQPRESQYSESRQRRGAAKVSYAEPPLGKKLRRGDPGTSSIYGSGMIIVEPPKAPTSKAPKSLGDNGC